MGFEFGSLTKDRFVDILRKRGFEQKYGKFILELLLEEMKQALERGEEVKISNFGCWRTRDKRARLGRNPNTGEAVEIASRRVITFHPSNTFRNLFNRSVTLDPDAD